ncbi:MAG: hypothetical protein H7249_20910 [Chitinophagaceae bacterium]|nr:hypothetical protein [Oligoflexus sp.]
MTLNKSSYVLTVSLALGACSAEGPGKLKIVRQADAQGAAADKSSPGGTAGEKLNLAAITVDPGIKDFDFTKPTEFIWTTSSDLIFAHPDGKSVTFNIKNLTWSSVATEPTAIDYLKFYDFREAGSIGTHADTLTLHHGQDAIILMKESDDFKASTMIGLNPGFAAFTANSTVKIIMAVGAEAKLYVPANVPVGLVQVYPCNVRCLFWGFDGTKILTYTEAAGWSPLSQAIDFSLLGKEKVVRMALHFVDASPLAADSILIQSDAGHLLGQVASTVVKPEPSFAQIKPVADRFCVTCHLDDGFEKENTWKSLKSSIETRLRANPSAKGAMPPAETTIGKSMSQGERDIILAWIVKQNQIERGTIGGTTDPVVDTSDISGDLKTQVALYACSSCHGTKNEWWTTHKANAIVRINAGTMPPTGALTVVQKKAFVDILNALK